MFPLNPTRIGQTLLEIADAMLRPEPVAAARVGTPCVVAIVPADVRSPQAARTAPARHPHRQRVRIQRRRRLGATPPRPQDCISPLAGRAGRATERSRG